jgi:hypothetical protein
VLSEFDEGARKAYEIIHRTSTLPSMSGGPALNRNGQVIGLNASGAIANPNIPSDIQYAVISLQRWSNSPREEILASISNVAPQTTVFCDTSGAEPLTVAMGSNSRTDLILWRDRSFESQGWSPLARCRYVSKKLNALYAALGQDFLIYHGRVNNRPVLCAVKSVWGRYQCRQGGEILVLKHNESAEQVFQDLMAAATQAEGGRPVVR